MILICGASASGKTAVLKHLVSHFYYEKMVTTTTRPKRIGEKNGKDYHFLKAPQFNRLKEEGGFIETTHYQGYDYGTQITKIKSRSAVILDPLGINAFFKKRPHKDFIVYIKTPKNIRKERMKKRGDNESLIQKRLETDDLIFDLKLLSHIDLIIEYTNESIEELALKIHLKYKEFKHEIRTQKR